MTNHRTLSDEQRIIACALFEEGYGSKAVSTRLGLRRQPVKLLYDRWRLHGRAAVGKRRPSQLASFEDKVEIVRRHLAGESLMSLAEAYHLSGPRIISKWVETFRNEGEDGLRPKPKGRPPRAPADTAESELERLRAENAYLQAELAYLKKLKALKEAQRQRSRSS